MARKQTADVVELSAEQEALAQRVYEKIRGKAEDELRDMVRLMMSKADHEFFGPGEFELRDKLNQFGAMVVAEAANERAKKGVPG
jgi:hypothetical protein